MARTLKLTTRALEQLAKNPPDEDVFDTDLSGFHVRPGKRGLSFRLFYRTLNGKQRILTLGRYGHLTAVQAREAAKEALALVAQGGDPRTVLEEAKAEAERQQQQTVGSYLDGPYTAYQGRKKDGHGTLRRIRNTFADWLDKPMASLDRAAVERWQAKEESAKKPRAYSTLRRDLSALCTMLAHASERGVIEKNPLSRNMLQKPALTEEELAEQGSERRYLEAEEVEALFDGLDAYQEQRRSERRNSRVHGKAYLPSLDQVEYVDHVKPWVLTMYYTGFRPGDLFGLRWEHVNLDFATIRKVIEKTAHKCPEPMTFPLSQPVREVLEAWWKQQGEPQSGLVFPSPVNGKRMAQTAMQRPWVNVKKLRGLPEDLQLYTLRHNFASQLVMGGVDLLTVSKLMAHRDIQTTIKHYAHLAPDHKRDAVELFARKAPAQKMGASVTLAR